MLSQSTRIGRLVRWNTGRKDVFARTLSIDLNDEASRAIGEVQGLIGGELSPKTGDALVANIEDALENGIEEALRTSAGDTGAEALFEMAVTRVNRALSRLLSERGLVVPADNVNGVLVAQNGDDVYAAVWGKPGLLLARRRNGGTPRMFDLLSAQGEAAGPPNGLRRGFTNLVTGKLTASDVLLITDGDLPDLLGKDELASIMTARGTEAMSTLLRDALLARHQNLTLAVLLLQGNDPLPRQVRSDARIRRTAGPLQGPAPKTKIGYTVSTTQTVKDTIKGVAASATKVLQSAAEGLREETAKEGVPDHDGDAPSGPDARESVSITEDPPTRAGGQTRPPIADAARRSLSAMAASGRTFALGIAGLRSRDGRRAFLASARQGTDRFIERLIEWYNTLPRRRKALLISALAMILILNGSVGLAGIAKMREKAATAYDQSVTRIRQKIDSAEASIIYSDEERAHRLLDEAVAGTVALPDRTEDQRALREELLASIALKQDALRHAVTLPAPEVAASVMGDSTPSFMRMTPSGTDAVLWALDGGGGIYRISSAAGDAAYIGSAQETEIFVSGHAGLLVGSERGGVRVFTGEGADRMLTLDNGGHDVRISDAATFGSRLYVLDAVHNRILRHQAVDGGFASPQMYMKDGTDLSSAVSFAIDGYVYVLHPDGSVTRLLRGERTDFTVASVQPSVTAAKKIRTDGEGGSLYVLDDGQGRIIRFDKKDGSLIAQYESDALRSATDFLVNESAREFLASDGNRILRLKWPAAE